MIHMRRVDTVLQDLAADDQHQDADADHKEAPETGTATASVRVASRSFLTLCPTEILTISTPCSLTPQASEAPILCDDHS